MKINKYLIFTFLFSISTFLSNNNLSFATDIVDEEETKNEIVLKEQYLKNYGGIGTEYIQSSCETSDGGYVVVGYTTSTNIGFENAGGYDAVIIKFDSDGRQEWISSYGTAETDEFFSVIEDNDGNIVVVGRADKQGIIVKYNNTGESIANKKIGGSSSNNITVIRDITLSEDGDYVLVGHSNATYALDGISTGSSVDSFIMKLGASFDRKWTTMYGYNKGDMFYGVDSIKDGGLIAVGYTEDVATSNNSSYNICVNKYNYSTGALQWSRIVKGSSYDYAYDTKATPDGGFIVVGQTSSSDIDGIGTISGYDGLIIKYDTNGKQEWIKGLKGSANDCFMQVEVLDNGEILAVGNSTSTNLGYTPNGGYDAIMVKYSVEGEQIWMKEVSGSGNDYFTSVLYINDNIYASGYTTSSDIGFLNKGSYDGFTLKLGEVDIYLEAIIKAEESLTKEALEEARTLINTMEEGSKKESYQIRLGKIFIGEPFEILDSSSNIDIFIENENSLTMTLSTNQITFKDFDATQDVTLEDAFTVTVCSSLPYDLNAFLVTEITSLDGKTNMDKRIFNLKEASQPDYKCFENVGEAMILKENCESGNDIVHPINIQLKGGITYKKDIYRTTIKIQAQQK